MSAAPVILALTTERQEAVWRAFARELGIDLCALSLHCELDAGLAAEPRAAAPGAVLVADLGALHDDGLTLGEFVAWKRSQRPNIKLVVTHAGRYSVSASERAWAQANGALEFIPRLATAEWETTVLPAVATVHEALGRGPVDRERVRTIARALGTANLDGHPVDFDEDPGGELQSACTRAGCDATGLAAEMRAAVALADREFRLKTYANCFVGSQAVDWLAQRFAVPRDRAVRIGQALAVRGHLYHVVREQAFADADYFYRFAPTDRRADSLDLDALVRAMRGAGGLEIKTRTYRGKSYADCVVAAEAIDWLVAKHGLSREAAECVGVRLVDLYIWHHVLDDHEFADGNFFFRFYADER